MRLYQLLWLIVTIVVNVLAIVHRKEVFVSNDYEALEFSMQFILVAFIVSWCINLGVFIFAVMSESGPLFNFLNKKIW